MTNSSKLKPDDVIKLRDFCSFVENLAEESEKSERSLEEYLRAFWLLVQANQNAMPSYALFAQMLSQALLSPIASFDNDWLNYTSPPGEVGYSRSADGNSWSVGDEIDPLKKMLLYQIADLHKMKDEGVLEQPPHILWLGVRRKGGETWYNFLPSTFLSCALGGLNAESESTDCHWSSLTVFFQLGQGYE